MLIKVSVNNVDFAAVSIITADIIWDISDGLKSERDKEVDPKMTEVN